MGVHEIVNSKRDEILRLAAKHGAFNVRVFGSVARGDATENSDVDFIVELEEGRSLIDHVQLKLDLEDLLGRRVDLVEPDGIHWYIKDRVLKEAVEL